ncbi:MAG TPA: type II toxin-antitoxin system RelE/ParE family toxin [Prolixibacteraceae bacterium]|nr:type II toxin-antitoxin system RelE/ParE family toxin [Prolixibacteraceae bacterium]
MKLVYTEQALTGLDETLDFISKNVSSTKVIEIRDRILDKIDTLINQPSIGQKELALEHLGLGHRRLIAGHCKIIYRIEDNYIYITDIFDSRQDPDMMKG